MLYLTINSKMVKIKKSANQLFGYNSKNNKWCKLKLSFLNNIGIKEYILLIYLILYFFSGRFAILKLINCLNKVPQESMVEHGGTNIDINYVLLRGKIIDLEDSK